MVFNNSILLGAAGQSGTPTFDTTLISNSVWLDGSADGLTAPSSTFSAQDGKEFTLGTWFQLTELGVSGALFCAGANPYTSLRHDGNNKIYLQTEAGTHILNTTAVFRDIGWYHILVSVDTTQSVNNNRVRIFINGVQTELTGTYPAVNHAYDFNTAVVHEVGDSFENGAFEGYLAQSFMIGSKSVQQGDFAITDFLDTFTLGTNGSQFIPKKHSEIKTLVDTGSSNSFLLQYENSGALGTDSSTNTNTFTATSMGTANQSTSTPSLVYPIVNALTKVGSAASTLEEGNTKATVNDNGGIVINPTLPFSGLWYFEINVTTNAAWYPGIGQQSAIGYNSTGAWNNTTAETHVWLSDHSGNYFNNNGSLSTYPIANPTTGRFAVAWDGDNRALYFGQISGSTITWTNSGDPTSGSSKTGAAPGNWPTTGTDPLYFIVIGGGTSVMEFDFDEDDWTGVTNRPAAAKVLNSANLTAPDYQGIDYFDATLYEGNGTGQRVGDFVPFTDAYTVDNSAMFEHDDARYLSRTIETPSSSGGKKGTWSAWFKTANIDTDNVIFDNGTTATNRFSLNMDASGQLIFSHGGTTVLKTSGDYKGDGAWHNVVLKVDTELDPGESGATPNRAIMFIDGVQLTSADLETTPTNTNIPEDAEIGYMDPGATQFVGSYNGSSANQWDGYLAEVVFLDNQYLNASSFGQVDTSTNRWVPKSVSGLTFGDCGFYLEFKVAPGTGSGAGTDTSGNSNNFTQGGTWATTDQFTDTPSQNFAIMDFYHPDSSTATTFSEGNLKVSMGTAAGDGARGTLAYNGKMYWEVELDAISTNSGSDIGIATRNHNLALTSNDSSNTNAFLGVSSFDSNLKGFINGAALDTSYGGLGNNFGTAGKYLMFAVDTNAGKFWAGYDGTWFGSGNPAGGTNDSGQDISLYDTWFPAISRIGSAGSGAFIFNFGQRSFAHTPPTGFSKLNQDNIDDTASKITAWAWIKNRDADDNHILVDRVRGVGKDLHSNSDTSTGLAPAEVTNMNTVQRFLQRGVQIGSDVEVNTANESYVLWQWLVGDSATTGTAIPADNPPSLASTSLVADAGHFAVISYTGNATSGATIGHGMSGAPEMVWVKERDNANGWIVSSTSIGFNKVVRLDTSDPIGVDGGAFNSTAPSSTLITLGSNSGTNRSSGQMICYAFRSVPGVCKIGSYIPNNTIDGPYVNLGFTPAYLLIKCVETTNPWIVFDNTRGPTNPVTKYLLPNSNAVEASSGRDIDFLSDGYKIRENDSDINGGTSNAYIYMAIADLGGNGTLPPIYSR